MTSILMAKANLLGISDAELLTNSQLEEEVRYASLSKTARASISRKRSVVHAVVRVTVPDPLFFPVGRPSMTREELRNSHPKG
jgi:hypothetical protein